MKHTLSLAALPPLRMLFAALPFAAASLAAPAAHADDAPGRTDCRRRLFERRQDAVRGRVGADRRRQVAREGARRAAREAAVGARIDRGGRHARERGVHERQHRFRRLRRSAVGRRQRVGHPYAADRAGRCRQQHVSRRAGRLDREIDRRPERKAHRAQSRPAVGSHVQQAARRERAEAVRFQDLQPRPAGRRGGRRGRPRGRLLHAVRRVFARRQAGRQDHLVDQDRARRLEDARGTVGVRRFRAALPRPHAARRDRLRACRALDLAAAEPRRVREDPERVRPAGKHRAPRIRG